MLCSGENSNFPEKFFMPAFFSGGGLERPVVFWDETMPRFLNLSMIRWNSWKHEILWRGNLKNLRKSLRFVAWLLTFPYSKTMHFPCASLNGVILDVLLFQWGKDWPPWIIFWYPQNIFYASRILWKFSSDFFAENYFINYKKTQFFKITLLISLL